MSVILWILTGLLAVAMLGAGAMKLATSKADQQAKGMTYVEDFTEGQIKTIGALEVLGAIGLVAPAFVDGLEWLVPTAAIGLLITMIGAVVVHVRRQEPFIPPLVLGVVAAVVAIGRIWVAPF